MIFRSFTGVIFSGIFRFLPPLCAAVLTSRAATLPDYASPPPPALPAIDYHAGAVNGKGKWHAHAPTIPGWHYSFEQLLSDGLTWEALPDGQFYGNGQPLRYFVTEGPLPAGQGATGQPTSTGGNPWQLRFVTFRLEMRRDGLGSAFRISRAATTYPPLQSPVAAWDAMLTEALPAMPAGSRIFLFQGWEDTVNKIQWQTAFEVNVTENGPPPESLAATPQQAEELNVFQQVRTQLLGAMTSPFTPGASTPPGPKKLIRLRRTAIDTNGNGLFDWWELQNGYAALTAGMSAQSDPDGDGLSQAEEQRRGTNPKKADTDGDGSLDGRDPDPANAAVYPPLFDVLWRGLQGYYLEHPPGTPYAPGPDVNASGDYATGGIYNNWVAPYDESKLFSARTTLAAASAQLRGYKPWPAAMPAGAQALQDLPPVVDLIWKRQPTSTPPATSTDVQVYDRAIRYRRAAATPDPLPVTLLRLALPPEPDYTPQLKIGPISAVEKVDLVIPANATVSPLREIAIPAGDPVYSTGTGSLHRRDCWTELQRAPAVLTVNANFDEGIIDAATGFAKPDSSDGNLKADRNIPWRQVKSGDLITTGLHQGWFGIHPSALYYTSDEAGYPDFYQGASIKIRKIAQTDPDTDSPESGHVRFWVTRGDGATAENWPVDIYDRASPAFTALELNGLAYGRDATLPRTGANVRWWIEGLTPGKCTLEFTCVRGPHTIIHRQTFLVATHQTKAQWLVEAHEQMRLQTAAATLGRIDLDFKNYDPAAGFFELGGQGRLPNHWYVREIYYYYRQLFKQRPEQFYWAGMAKVAGASVYAGMSEIQLWKDAQVNNVAALTVLYNTYYQSGYKVNYGCEKFLDQFLVTGNKEIFGDMGWAHLAYQSSGIWALDFVKNSVSTDDERRALADFSAWDQIDLGIKNNNINSLRAGNRNLLRREQERVMQQYYNFVRELYLRPPPSRWLTTAVGAVYVQPNDAGLVNAGEWLSANAVKNPIPGGPAFRDGFPMRRLDNLDDRWAWIENSASGMLERWLGISTAGPNLSAGDRSSLNQQRMYDAASPFANTGLGLPEEP